MLLVSLVSVSASIFMSLMSTNCWSSSILFSAVMLLILTCAIVSNCCADCCVGVGVGGPGLGSIPLIISRSCTFVNLPSLVRYRFESLRGPSNVGVYRVGQRNPEVSLNRLNLHMRHKIGGESHAPGLPVHQLSIDTTFVGYISFICPG